MPAAGGIAVPHFIRQQPLGTAGLLVIVHAVRGGLRDWVAPYDPLAVDYGGMLAPPVVAASGSAPTLRPRRVVAHHLRLAHGAARRLPASLVGCTLGAISASPSAYFGGRIDMIIQRFMDVILAFPIIVLALAVVGGSEFVLGIDAT